MTHKLAVIYANESNILDNQKRDFHPECEAPEYQYVLKIKEKDSESDFHYHVSITGGVEVTTPFPEKSKLFKSRKDASLYANIKNLIGEYTISKLTK